MPEVINDEVLHAFSVVGPVNEVAAGVSSRFADVVSRFSLYTPYSLDGESRREIIAGYRRRFRLGALLSVAIAQSTLYAFRPSWIRYTDNSRGFGYHVEIEM